jgi:uncharacterized protein YjbI with pentapeptide repeats
MGQRKPRRPHLFISQLKCTRKRLALVGSHTDRPPFHQASARLVCWASGKARLSNVQRRTARHPQRQGVKNWNAWYKANLVRVNLSGADLRFENLRGANLSGADRNMDLRRVALISADLRMANLSRARLNGADLLGADLRKANLREADLRGANLSEAKLGGADLSRTNLSRAALIATNLEDAILTGARVYGTSIWDVKLQGAIQTALVITPLNQPEITVDNLEVAQFIYLLLNNAKIRDVIDTITSKAVLILGRFTPERKATLDALRDALRRHNYLPILFDFEKPSNRDFTETVSTLAHLARFVIADLTDPRSIPQELAAIILGPLMVPIRPLLLGDETAWSMFRDLARRPQVIPPFHYTNDKMLLSSLERDVIVPAEQKARELAGNV